MRMSATTTTNRPVPYVLLALQHFCIYFSPVLLGNWGAIARVAMSRYEFYLSSGAYAPLSHLIHKINIPVFPFLSRLVVLTQKSHGSGIPVNTIWIPIIAIIVAKTRSNTNNFLFSLWRWQNYKNVICLSSQ